MKLIWSPETASKAYLETVKSCEKFTESGVAELLSAMAGGWNAKLIVEAWSHGGPMATSVGLAVAARHTCGRHVCIVPDERSRQEYIKAMRSGAAVALPVPEVVVGEAEAALAGLSGVDFLVVDSKRRDFGRVLRLAKVSSRGAVFACKNAWQRNVSGFRWQWALERGTRVVRSVFLPVGKGLDIAHIGSANGGTAGSRKGPSRWIKHVDQRSGEEHVFRE
ncbi:S-adenosyl-L-methionine-dependent methyltransferase [Parasponia andersonii]|uniref:S-adenosyl-L-methionine-dependent methyltransferase n=1 Tax=Parasponia andersonii TaxID=3476 RepID=A0A2P5BHY0_PARAD|nr:S-adenosyl-L-methionine-dependent methyltransferase [Parasponia andersonii]